MTTLKALTPSDQLFLFLERRNQPMHVGGLFLATPPPGADRDYLPRMIERLRTFTDVQPPFDRQLTRKFGTWFWERDQDFDIDHHFRPIALPRPGRIRELLRLVGQLHASPLDRARPLWELYLIDGVEGGRFAIYTKIHHALVDGIAGMRLVQRALTDDPEDRDRPPPWAIKDPRRARPSKIDELAPHDPHEGRIAQLEGGVQHLMSAVSAQLASLGKVGREVARTVREAQSDEDLAALRAPACVLNQRISGSRRFAAQSYSLARIRAAARAHRATVNDVVLAMCASALRRYLLDRGALPPKPLIAMVPVSLRRDESDSGNQVAMILANLGTNLEDPAERLATIRHSVQHAKERYAQMTPTEILVYASTLLGPAGLNFLTGAAPRVQAFNVVISNVPGPKERLYWGGARIDGMYPVSIVVDGQALNITLTSYVDAMELGVVACRRTLPHVQRLLEYFEIGLAELEGVTDENELP